ncbi:MAG: carbohydrate binding family 9 domain-containing protein, partial [Myxococcota bacterium]
MTLGRRRGGLWLCPSLLALPCALCPAVAPVGAGAASAAPPALRVVWTEEAPVIDGRLDDPVWKRAALIDRLIQVEPVEGAEPSERTEIRLLSDADHLYFGIRCYDREPDQIIAQKMLRDVSVQTEDRISIAIDTFRDFRNGYLLQVNALGSRRDGLIEGGDLIPEWDGIWSARARIDAQGWTVEIALPYKTLSFDPEGDAWGLNILRAIRRRGELLRWAAADRDISFINMKTAGVLQGMRGIQQGRGLDVVPVVTARIVDDASMNRQYTKLDPGGDLFYKLTPSLAATLTVNTDFGDAEVDERQVNLTRFGLFFPEKRDFFLRDAGVFRFGGLEENGRPFHSRNIGLTRERAEVPIRAGVKLTGRVGPVHLGFLDVQTGAKDGVGAKNLLVGRVSVDVFGESALGLIVTRGDPHSRDENFVLGGDFRYRKSDFLGHRVLAGTLWLQQSESTGVDHGQNAFGGTLSYPNDRVNWELGAQEIQRNFHPALGFVNRVGIRRYDAIYRFRTRPGGSVRTLDARVRGEMLTNLGDRIDTAVIEVTLPALETAIGDRLELRYRRDHERLTGAFEISPGVVIPSGRYDFDRGLVILEASRSRPLGGDLEFHFGDFFSGRKWTLISKLEWRPTRHWQLGAEYEHNEFSLREG